MKRQNMQSLHADEEMWGSLSTYKVHDGRWCVEFGVWNLARDDDAFVRIYFSDIEHAHQLLAMLQGGYQAQLRRGGA